MGDGRAEGLSATGDRGQAAISLTRDTEGTHIRILESSQLEGSYVGDLLTFANYSQLQCMLYIRSPELIHLITVSLYSLTTLTHFPPTPTQATTNLLCFCEFSFDASMS